MINKIKWWQSLAVAVIAATIYIYVDDNNIISDRAQNVVYFIFWLSVFVTIFLVIRRNRQ